PLALSTRTLASASLAGETLTIVLRDTGVPRCGCAGSACSGGGLHTVASWTSGARVSAIVHTTVLATSSTISRAIAGRALRRRKGRPCLSNAVPSVICATTYAL